VKIREKFGCLKLWPTMLFHYSYEIESKKCFKWEKISVVCTWFLMYTLGKLKCVQKNV
jgi:hypothetical protein